MSFSKEDVVVYRLERAHENINEAKLLDASGFWNTVASRLYYACFYAVIGLLLKSDLRSKSHSGAKDLFLKEFLKTGKVEK